MRLVLCACGKLWACAKLVGRMCHQPVCRSFEVYMAVSRLQWLCFLFLLSLAVGAGSKKDEKKKKSVLDLSERDVHRIYEQWEVSNLSV